jgi:hypothetical protein
MANPLKAEQEPASGPIRPKSIGSSFSAGYRLQYATRPNSSLASATSVLRRPSFHPLCNALKCDTGSPSFTPDRNKDGEISHKHGKTPIRVLRKVYG